jgi:hypothetical protein
MLKSSFSLGENRPKTPFLRWLGSRRNLTACSCIPNHPSESNGGIVEGA